MPKRKATPLGVGDIVCRVWRREAELLAQHPVRLVPASLQYKLSEEARRKESERLHASRHKARAFDVMLSRFFAAARQIKPGRFTDDSVWPRSVAMYCEYRRTGKKNYGRWNAIDIEEVVNALEQGTFADELLRVLWAECPEECKAMGLPELPGGDPNSLEGYASADTLEHNYGIVRVRLSEAKQAGKVKAKPAPARMIDSDGKTIRVLYNIEDAKKHCSPKRVKKTSGRGLGRQL